MLQVTAFTFNPFGVQTYVLHDSATLEAAVIDPGCCSAAEWQALRTYVAEGGLSVRHVLLTHCHLDHVAGSGLCVREYGVGLAGPLDDQLALPTVHEQAFLFGLDEAFAALPEPPAAIVRPLAHGDSLTLGAHRIDVIDVPGHSPHGLCYYAASEGVLFAGDVLFCGSIGRTDFGARFGCSHRALVEGIAQRLLSLPPDVRVLPGHGPQTTIGREAASNPYL